MDDALVEWSETVTVSLAPDSRYVVGPSGSATVTVVDSDVRVEATTVPGTGIRLDWPDHAGETAYRILRATAGTDTWTEIGTTAADVTTYTDSTAIVATTYLYRVAAESNTGESAFAESEPAKAVSAEGDEDGDGLNNLDEYNSGTDIFYFDSDGDLLADGWEVQYGLDPLNSDQNANGISDDRDDFDSDGLNNLQESNRGSNPNSSDTGGDGVSDADEVGQGSVPTDASDGGEPPADDMKGKFRLTVGDPSGSNSERWKMRVDDTGDRPQDYSVEFAAPGFGQVGSDDVWFQAGESYEVRVDHLGSNLSTPDYDWVARIEPTPNASQLPYFIVDENTPKVLQKTEYHGNDQNLLAGKVAYFHIPLLDADVDSDNNNGLMNRTPQAKSHSRMKSHSRAIRPAICRSRTGRRFTG